MTHPTLTDLQAEHARLVLPNFAETEALALGQILIGLAIQRAHPVVIDIRTADRTLFHASLPGSAPLNDRWARRKSNTALMFHESSLAVGTRHRDKGETLAKHGLDTDDFSDHGGAVPIRVHGLGVVAVATVSGLAQLEDHALVVESIEQFLRNA